MMTSTNPMTMTGPRGQRTTPARGARPLVVTALAGLVAGLTAGLTAGLLGSCGSPPVPAARFANAPPAAAVDDRRDVPRPPRARTVYPDLHHAEGYMSLVTRPLALPRPRRALGTNALDEVPDSTWFTNRIGVRALSPEELRAGPARAGNPEAHPPWTVHSTKVMGVSLGFVISDARGERYLLKLEQPGFPELQSGADAIASRILWAAGYNVPEDHVVYVHPDELVVAPDARLKDALGRTRRLDRAELARRLAPLDRDARGRIRGVASRLLDGASLGGHPGGGVREDDPNDRIPHELRRELRGAAALFSWLDLDDVKEDNTLDIWTADPADPARHYVKHYLIDFDKGLGVTATLARDPRRGRQYVLDVPSIAASLVTLGVRTRSWELRRDPQLPGVGMLDVATYDPARWKPDSPAYLPFRTADDRDGLWAAKILVRFTRAQLRAAAEAARFTDPRAADYVADALDARRRIAARYWFGRVSPLDGFAVERDRLCFDDLMIVHRLEPVAQVTRYTVTAYDQAGAALGAALELPAAADGRSCAGPVPLAAGGDGYTIVRVDLARLGRGGATYVHLARDPSSGAPRVIGVWRP